MKKFEEELEKFFSLRVHSSDGISENDLFEGIENEKTYTYDNRKKIIDELWESKKSYAYSDFPMPTNHDICQLMFWNAFKGKSSLYIQMEDIRNLQLESDEKIVLDCSLFSVQMLDYDFMMFEAMDSDERYEAMEFYRPFIFGYNIEVDKEKLDELKDIQNYFYKNERVEEYAQLLFKCSFDLNKHNIAYMLDGWVIQSASPIEKIKASLAIIEDPNSTREAIEKQLDKYKLDAQNIKNSNDFISELRQELDASITRVNIYKIGDGNCVYLETEDDKSNFFYDFGYNYKHIPQKNNTAQKYSKSVDRMVGRDNKFVILSHWDMDHIASYAVASKKMYSKKCFAPDCVDAGTNAKRLAKYLDMKGSLIRLDRNESGKLIGEIDITTGTILGKYKLYMGGLATSVDRSHANCQGIAILFEFSTKNKKLLMMGDVNYRSFNLARIGLNKTKPKETEFADMDIDYLIAPHHGSQHTGYKLINGASGKSGEKAVFCCKNDSSVNRPNKDHRDELAKRFKEVLTTERDTNDADRVKIVIDVI